MSITIHCPEQLTRETVASLKTEILKKYDRNQILKMDLSDMVKFDLWGLQLLLSCSISSSQPVLLYPRQQGKRIEAMSDFIGLVFHRHFRLEED